MNTTEKELLEKQLKQYNRLFWLMIIMMPLNVMFFSITKSWLSVVSLAIAGISCYIFNKLSGDILVKLGRDDEI